MSLKVQQLDTRHLMQLQEEITKELNRRLLLSDNQLREAKKELREIKEHDLIEVGDKPLSKELTEIIISLKESIFKEFEERSKQKKPPA